jgi:outer membrane protein
MLIQKTRTLAAIAIAYALLVCAAYAAPPLLPPSETEEPDTMPAPVVAQASPLPPASLLDPQVNEAPAALPPIEPAPAIKSSNAVLLKSASKVNTDAIEPSPSIPAEAVIEASITENAEQFRNALASVYANHPQIKAEREAVKAADEAVSQAVSGFRPNIALGYERGRQRVNDANQRWEYGDISDKSLTVSQPIFNGGESLADFQAAKNRVKAARAQLLDTEQQVFSNAIVAYTDVVSKQLVLKLNQNNVEVLHKQFDATKARFDVGDLTRTDVSQSEARMAKAEADERQALGEYETAKVTFRRIVGYDPPDDLQMPPLPAKLPPSLIQASTLAQVANPSLEAAKFLERAASSDVMARTAAVLPDVTLQGSMSRGDRLSSFSGIRRNDDDSIVLNVSIPLYQSGAEWSRIRQARNQAQQARFATIDTHDAVVENVTRAWHDFHTAQAVITSTQESTKSAEVALEGVRQENQYGVRTILDVLNAEQEFFFAKVDLVRAQTAEKTQAYRLLATMGKLTAQDLGLPVTLYNPKEHYDSVKYQLIGL